MNRLTVRTIGLSLVLFGGLTACKGGSAPETASAPAAPTPQTASQPASSPASTAPAEAAPENAQTAIPDTADGIWQAIDQQRAELKATIASGDLGNVHHRAFAIRDLVAALPAQSASLAADAQARLQEDAKFVATLADRLDAAGDAGDRAGVQANFDKLDAVLNGIARNK